MKKSIKLITILLAMLSAFVFISCDQASVEDLFDDGRGDNPDPGPMSGLVAPSWLVSKSPSAAGATDGIIYGVTPYMEYSFGRSNSWTQCPGGKIEGLSAGNVFVRYAGTEGRLAGEAVLVCMDDVSTYDGTPKLLSAEELADYNVLVVNENTGEVETKKADTLGSYPDVYLIESAKAWNTVATDGSTYNGKVLILGDNLRFTETTGSTMMNYKFNGKIYGNGYLIDNFCVSTGNNGVGLISEAGNGLYLNYVQMTNCDLRGISSNTNDGFGSLIGIIKGKTTVIGCSVFCGKLYHGSAGMLIGSVLGSNAELTLAHSKVTNSTIVTAGNNIGGLIGRLGYNEAQRLEKPCIVYKCSVTDCWIESTSTGTSLVGGLAGMELGEQTTIKCCTVTNCIVKAGGYSVGGLVGNIKFGASLEDCTATNCDVSSAQAEENYVGGLVGRIHGSGSKEITIKNCKAISCNITGTTNRVGGLVGCTEISSVSVENCMALDCNVVCSDTTMTGGILGSGLGTFRNCCAGTVNAPLYLNVHSNNNLNGTSASATMTECTSSITDTPIELTFPTKEQIQDFPASKLPYVYVTYKTARGSIGAPYSDGKMTVSIPYVRSASFGSSASGNIPKPLDASADWLMANGKVRNMEPVVPDEVVIADLLN